MPLLTNMLPRRLLIWGRVRQFILSLHNLASVVKVLPNPDLLDIKSLSPTNSVDNLPSNQLSLLLRHSHCFHARNSEDRRCQVSKLSSSVSTLLSTARSQSLTPTILNLSLQRLLPRCFGNMTAGSFLRSVWSSPSETNH